MIKADKELYSDITDKIIASAYDGHDQLGFGFAEKVYENAMMMPQRGINATQQAPVSILKTDLSENTLSTSSQRIR